MERYPNLKKEVGGSIHVYETSSLLDRKTFQVINCLMCFDDDLSTFCLNKTKTSTWKSCFLLNLHNLGGDG